MLFFLLAVVRAQCPTYSPLKNPYFGDTHVHTHLSLDARIQGTTVTPTSAYAFAKGQTIDTTTIPIAPLDFAIVTDHAEFLGELEICNREELPGYEHPICQRYRKDPQKEFVAMNMALAGISWFGKPPPRLKLCGKNGQNCRAAAQSPWLQIQRAAQNAYEPCSFTSFIGYEWSGSPLAQNLHRNVIFENEHVPSLPISFFEASRPEQLWKALDEECKAPCAALTIPHNSNLSNGQMFLPYQRFRGKKLLHYAHKRAYYEPLVEVFQHKGSSECGVGSPDEECRYESLPYNNLVADRYNGFLTGEPKKRDFVRGALETGLRIEERIGVNPYQYGMIASTDTHNGTPGAVSKEEYAGHGGVSGKDIENPFQDNPRFNPGGLAVLWAEENTRSSLFAAMRRKEVYGTSGSRIVMRFFAGENLPEDLCHQENRIEQAYKRGVPMGGVLRNPKELDLFFEVEMDPMTKPIAQVQVIKGTLKKGKPHSEIIDLLPTEPTGYTHSCAVWNDPNFDPKEPAFYYLRVLEQPSIRWTQRLCQQKQIDCTTKVPKAWKPCCDPSIPKQVQERAWSSPIWTSRH
ncbi:MAG: DUF3604 domain-containing protein [Myxococcota bacterium]|nr:DUF3604 domain-containing protein [Myxococcota bacterium]